LNGATRLAQCGWYEVAEDRTDPASRKLRLRVVVLPARGSRKADPLFLLAGGPGQAASEAFPLQLPYFAGITLHRDLVMIDQRGTGASAPLDCELSNQLEQLVADRALEQLANTCRPKLKGALDHYTTPEAADDVDEVRRALGYGRINLLGGSYGTRLALVYARRHPDAVRTMVLDGTVPTSMAIPLYFPRDGEKSLELLVAACSANPACARAYPDLRGHIDRLISGLRAEPRKVTIQHPRSGEEVSFTMTGDVAAQSLRALLYSPELSALLPLAVRGMEEGRYDTLIASLMAIAERASEMMSHGLFFSVICSEDVPQIQDDDIARLTTGTFLGRGVVDQLRTACTSWPRAELPAAYFAPVRSDAPALVLSGVLDPATPPVWGEQVVATLSRGKHVVVPSAGHGTLTTPCVMDLVEKLLDTEDAQDIDASCVADAKRPPFFIDYAGPQE